MNDLTVRRDEQHGRYEAYLGGERVGVADFAQAGDAVALPHVQVDPPHEGRGYASELTRAALDDLRSRGVTRILPQCPFVRAWVTRHPEYQDLLGS